MCYFCKRRRNLRTTEIALLKRVLKNQVILDQKIEAIGKQSVAQARTLKGIAMANEQIQSEINDLNASVSVISTGVTTLQSNLALAQAQIADLAAAGVSQDVIDNLSAAVDGAQAIAAKFEAAVDPAQPTPAPEDLPAPVEPVVTPEAPAEGADEAPADSPVVADGGEPAVDGETNA